MSQAIKVEIQSVREPYENYRGQSRVVFNDRVLASGDGAVVCEAARVLVRDGIDPATVWLEAWRGDMLCLRGLLGNFAFQTVADPAKQSGPRFVPYRPFNLDRHLPLRGSAQGGD